MYELTPSDRGLRYLLYGKSGAGKTTLSATAMAHPSMRDVLYINIDDGLTSIVHVPGIKAVDIKKWSELEGEIKKLSLPDGSREPGYNGINTVVIDSVTKMSDDFMYNLAEQAVARGKRADTATREIQDWGKMSTQIEQSVNKLSQLGLHLILIAGEDVDKTAQGVVMAIGPAMNPALQRKILHMMDAVWYVREREGKYSILVKPRDIYYIKTRNHLFAAALKEATEANAPTEEDKPLYSGWWPIRTPDAPTLATLYDIYLTSVSQFFEKET